MNHHKTVYDLFFEHKLRQLKRKQEEKQSAQQQNKTDKNV